MEESELKARIHELVKLAEPVRGPDEFCLFQDALSVMIALHGESSAQVKNFLREREQLTEKSLSTLELSISNKCDRCNQELKARNRRWVYRHPSAECQKGTFHRSIEMKKILTTLLLILFLFFHITKAQQTQGARVLVVYNANDADSIDVANYYMTRRNLPSANKCAITPSSSVGVSWDEFNAAIKTPISNCLDAVGRNNILYVVLTYNTPYKVYGAPSPTTVHGTGISIDQYIADIWDQTSFGINPYYAYDQSKANIYQPFVALADYRALSVSQLIYSVWRLDARDAALAKGLVDKAIFAESNGLSGQGCFDERQTLSDAVSDSSYGAGDWDIYRAAESARANGFSVVEDSNEAEFGTAPAPLRCDNAGLYAGWYSANNYNDVFTWNPGAVGFHLDSYSASDPRGGTNWADNALQRGITITAGALDEPYLDGLEHVDGVFRSLFQGANVGDALLRNTYLLKWNIIYLGDPLYRPFPSMTPTSTPTPTPAPTPTPIPTPTPTPSPTPSGHILLSGGTFFPDGSSANYTDVVLADSNGVEITETQEQNSTYQFEVAPGSYQINVRQEGYNFNPSKIVLTNISSNLSGLNITMGNANYYPMGPIQYIPSTSPTPTPTPAPTPTPIPTPTPTPSPTPSGHIVLSGGTFFPDGSSANYTNVVLADSNGVEITETEEQNSTYQFEVAPGSYQINVRQEGYNFNPSKIVLTNISSNLSGLNITMGNANYYPMGPIQYIP